MPSKHLILVRSDNPKIQECIQEFRIVEGFNNLSKVVQSMTGYDSMFYYYQDMADIHEHKLARLVKELTQDELGEYIDKTNRILAKENGDI